MSNPFTTTGPVEQTVFHCMLMDAMKNYFSYKAVLACGIPDITLHGVVEDWRSIVNRTNQLTEIFPDFVWYLNRVKAHILKFIDTAAGSEVDRTWWNTMILDEELGSGGDRMFTGWLADFFPYRYHGQKRLQNQGEQIDFDDLNTPVVSLTDFKLDNYGVISKMMLSSGFVGISQNNETLAVRPVLGWMTYYVI